MTYILEIHVFGAVPGGPDIQFWERTDCSPTDMNPILLKSTGDSIRTPYQHLFSLRRIEGDEAQYWPFATHTTLHFVDELPSHGFHRSAGVWICNVSGGPIDGGEIHD